MSGVRPSEGVGSVTWWGFSPARDLRAKGPGRPWEKQHVLLVGSSDPRHILKTIAGLEHTEKLHVWVVESSMEVVARQMLLLHLALSRPESMGVHEKTELFLEVFGNSELRSQTEEALHQVARQLQRCVSEQEMETRGVLDAALLKFKERDQLFRIFQQWVRSSTPSISTSWDARLRQHLGTRYDSRGGCFDWDLAMKLHQKGGGVISKQQYFRWRERGFAFEMREGIYNRTNATLLSTRVLPHRADKVAVRGYWGDMVSSPYISFGIESQDQSLLRTQNGTHVKTAQDISFANVETLFQALSSRWRSTHPESNQEPVNTEGLMNVGGVTVSFLPMDSLSKLPEKKKYSKFFHTIYCSASLSHQITPSLKQISSPGAVLVMELARFLLELNKEQEESFKHKVFELAGAAGFEPWTQQEDDSHAIFSLNGEGMTSEAQTHV